MRERLRERQADPRLSTRAARRARRESTRGWSRTVASGRVAARAPEGRPTGSGRVGSRRRIGGTPVKYGDPGCNTTETQLHAGVLR